MLKADGLDYLIVPREYDNLLIVLGLISSRAQVKILLNR